MRTMRRTGMQRRVAALLMTAPYLVLLLAFGLGPIVQSVVSSFAPGSRKAPAGGFDNWIATFSDFRFLPALANVAVFLAIYVPVMMVTVTLMALLLDTLSARGSVPLRVAYIVPAAISGSVAVLVWYFMLEPQLSPFRDLLKAVGLHTSQDIWRQPNLVFIFAAMAFFTGAGNWIVLQYGSLQSVPQELIEAARVDGANAAQIAVRIKLPIISPYLVYMGVLSFAAGLQVFVEPQLISGSIFQGLASNWSLNQLAYTYAFREGNLPGAAVMSLVLLVVCVVAALVMIFKTDLFTSAKETH